MKVNTKITPNNPKPTTHMPITAPPLKAIPKALFIPCSLAAVAVLELEFVALFIPIIPAKALNKAPRIKAIALPMPKGEIEIKKKAITAKIMIIKYSLFKKAFAPSLM